RLEVPPAERALLRDVEGDAEERTDRYEQLVSDLAAGAQEVFTHERALGVVLTQPSLWREPVAEFVALLPSLLPDLRAEVIDDERGLVLHIRGSGPNHDRLVVAFQQWRRTLRIAEQGGQQQSWRED